MTPTQPDTPSTPNPTPPPIEAHSIPHPQEKNQVNQPIPHLRQPASQIQTPGPNQKPNLPNPQIPQIPAPCPPTGPLKSNSAEVGLGSNTHPPAKPHLTQGQPPPLARKEAVKKSCEPAPPSTPLLPIPPLAPSSLFSAQASGGVHRGILKPATIGDGLFCGTPNRAPERPSEAESNAPTNPFTPLSPIFPQPLPTLVSAQEESGVLQGSHKPPTLAQSLLCGTYHLTPSLGLSPSHAARSHKNHTHMPTLPIFSPN